MKGNILPPNLNVVITGDQSKATSTSFNDLVNSIVIGFVLVLLILMFFMGVTNAFFVALSVPLEYVRRIFVFACCRLITGQMLRSILLCCLHCCLGGNYCG